MTEQIAAFDAVIAEMSGMIAEAREARDQLRVADPNDQQGASIRNAYLKGLNKSLSVVQQARRKVREVSRGDAQGASITDAARAEALLDLATHRDAWRRALQLAAAMAAPAGIDHDDAAYWAHELRAFDRTIFALTTEPSQQTEGMRQSPALSDVLESCKVEHTKFEQWAAAQKYDMHEHPLHYLFLDPQTNAARQGWKAALRYVAEATSQSSTSRGSAA